MDKISFMDEYKRRLSELPISKDDLEKESQLLKIRIESLDETLLKEFLTSEKMDMLITEARSQLCPEEGAREHRARIRAISSGDRDFAATVTFESSSGFPFLLDKENDMPSDKTVENVFDDDSDMKIFPSRKLKMHSGISSDSDDEDSDMKIFEGNDKKAHPFVSGVSGDTQTIRISKMDISSKSTYEAQKTITGFSDFNASKKESVSDNVNDDIIQSDILSKIEDDSEHSDMKIFRVSASAHSNKLSSTGRNIIEKDATLLSETKVFKDSLKEPENTEANVRSTDDYESTIVVKNAGKFFAKSGDDDVSVLQSRSKMRNDDFSGSKEEKKSSINNVKKKRTENPARQYVNSVSSEEGSVVRSEDLSNPHPRVYMAGVIFAIFPFVVLFLVLFSLMFLVINILALSIMLVCVLFYFTVLAFLTGCGVFSFISAVSYSGTGYAAQVIAECGIVLIAFSFALLWGYFLLPHIRRAVSYADVRRGRFNLKMKKIMRGIKRAFDKVGDRL